LIEMVKREATRPTAPDTKEIDRAFQMLEVYGVPRERAKTVANGIQVLVTRIDKATRPTAPKAEQHKERRFECPKCGSYMFGSSQNADGTLTRHCHGNEHCSCGFTFPDSDDDKYFHDICEACGGTGTAQKEGNDLP